jgi:hypothetical protein
MAVAPTAKTPEYQIRNERGVVDDINPPVGALTENVTRRNGTRANIPDPAPGYRTRHRAATTGRPITAGRRHRTEW